MISYIHINNNFTHTHTHTHTHIFLMLIITKYSSQIRRYEVTFMYLPVSSILLILPKYTS